MMSGTRARRGRALVQAQRVDGAGQLGLRDECSAAAARAQHQRAPAPAPAVRRGRILMTP